MNSLTHVFFGASIIIKPQYKLLGTLIISIFSFKTYFLSVSSKV